MKKLSLLIVFFGCLLSPYAHAQSTVVVGTNVVDNTGALLASGQWCFGSSCFTVTNGAFSGTVSSSTQAITITNGGSTTYLTEPGISVAGSYFSWNGFVQPSNVSSTGLGVPRVACTPGAKYTATDTSSAYNCVAINGSGTWNVNAPGQVNINAILVNGAPVPTSAGLLGSNSGGQLINESTGAVTFGTVSASTVVAGIANGVINAVQFSSSSDIGAKINDSFAYCVSHSDGCHVFVPAGNYTQTTPIVVPNLTNQQIALTLDDGCNITYTGSGVAISTTTNGWSFRLEGGQLTGTSAGVAGVLLAGGTQDVYITRTKITGFTNGDGIINLGTNVVNIFRAVVKGNLNGVDLEASNGYASNAVSISFSHISNNLHWGIIDGTVSIFATGGVASPNFGNSYTFNDLEGNGSASTGSCGTYSPYSATSTCYGAILEGYTVSTVIQGNYFEGTYRPIVLGAPNGMAVLPILNAVSNLSNGGTPTGPYIVGNYLTSASNIYDFVSISSTQGATINGNSGSGGGTTCYVDIAGSVGLGGSTIGTDGNQAQATNTVCTHGSPGISGNYDIQGYYQTIVSAGGPIRLNTTASGAQNIAEFYNGTSTVASVDSRGAITGTIFKSGTASNTDSLGQLSLSSGTASYTFTGSYTISPICTASDTTATNPVRVNASTTSVTFTGTGSDVINYLCSERY